MIQLGSGYEKVCEYLQKHNINSLEEIVGMDAFHIFPRQGVTACKIRNVEFFGNVRVWGFKTNVSHKLAELGNSIFLDEKEAREYEVLQLHKRTLDQQQNIIKRRVEEIDRDLNKLDYLLERYPTTESRCRFKNVVKTAHITKMASLREKLHALISANQKIVISGSRI